eukprot:3315498-Amphidinium_carterae.1
MSSLLVRFDCLIWPIVRRQKQVLTASVGVSMSPLSCKRAAFSRYCHERQSTIGIPSLYDWRAGETVGDHGSLILQHLRYTIVKMT